MLKSLDNEQQLLARAIAGDAEAFGELYSFYYDAIRRYIAVRVRDVLDVEDLTEQVFLKAWEALSRYEQREVRFTSWLYRIAHNVVVDHYRRQRPTVSASRPDAETWNDQRPGTLDHVIAAEESATLARAVNQLPEEQKQVVLLRFVEGLSHSEVARVLDKSIGACRIIQHRALSTLSRMLASIVAVLIAIALLMGGTVVAAGAAVPGEILYPVKKVTEGVRLTLSPSAVATARLHLTFATERLDEAATLLERSQTDGVELALHNYADQLAAASPVLTNTHLPAADKAALASTFLNTHSNQIDRLTTLVSQAPPSLRAEFVVALSTAQQARNEAQQVIDASLEPPASVPSPVSPTPQPTTPRPRPTTRVIAPTAAVPPAEQPGVVPPSTALPTASPTVLPTIPPQQPAERQTVPGAAEPPPAEPPPAEPPPAEPPPAEPPPAEPPPAEPPPAEPPPLPVLPTSLPTPQAVPPQAPPTVPDPPDAPDIPDVPDPPDIPDPPDPPDIPDPPDPPDIPDPPDPPDIPDPPDPPDIPDPPDPPDIPDPPDPPDIPDPPDPPDIPDPPDPPDIPDPPDPPDIPDPPDPPDIPDPPDPPDIPDVPDVPDIPDPPDIPDIRD